MLYDLEGVSWHTTLQENYSTSYSAENFLGMFRTDFWSSRKPPSLAREARSSAEEHKPRKNDGREGSMDPSCGSARGIWMCSDPVLPWARPWQPPALPQSLLPKGSTCFEPAAARAASPALPHPSISVQGSSAPSQKFCPVPSKGAPNTLHFAGIASN